MTAPASQKLRIMDRSFGVASFKFNRWSAELDENQTLDDALKPDFWANVVDKIRGQDKSRGIGDIIEIRKRDTALFAEVIITAIDNGVVRVQPLRAYEPKPVSAPDSAPLATKWNPGKKCHEVIRKDDNTVMSTGHQTKDLAVAWIDEHVKAMASPAAAAAA